MAVPGTHERRKHKRIKKNFIARFNLSNDGISVYDSGNWEMVTTQNLGAGGVLFNYNQEIPIGSLVDMFINFPQIMKPVHCTGKVLRIDNPKPFSIFKIAANFIDISEQDKQQIDKSAEEFYSKQSGLIEP
jgi:hypothetical protein